MDEEKLQFILFNCFSPVTYIKIRPLGRLLGGGGRGGGGGGGGGGGWMNKLITYSVWQRKSWEPILSLKLLQMQ